MACVFTRDRSGVMKKVDVSSPVIGYEISIAGTTSQGKEFKPKLINGSIRIPNILTALCETGDEAIKEAVLAENVESTYKASRRSFWSIPAFVNTVKEQILEQYRTELANVNSGINLSFNMVELSNSDPVDIRQMHSICQEMMEVYLSEIQR